MARLGDLVEKVRSKNAGPFWLTIDIFCGDDATYRQVETGLSTQTVAEVLQQPAESFKRFPMPDLNVVKFSIPRPHIQGSRLDRDMHGAQWALLIEALDIE
ncbi:MAG: DUF4387 family protein [Rhizobiaceae bacterium]